MYDEKKHNKKNKSIEWESVSEPLTGNQVLCIVPSALLKLGLREPEPEP